MFDQFSYATCISGGCYFYVVNLINHLPNSVHFKTPLNHISSSISLSSTLNLEPRVLGCLVFVHLPKHKHTKIDPCTLCCVFFGFVPYKKGYKCYHPPTKWLYMTMDVTFYKTKRYFSPKIFSSSLQGQDKVEEKNWMVLLHNNGGINSNNAWKISTTLSH